MALGLEPLTFANGIAPMVALLVTVVVLPVLLAGPTLSQRRLAVAMLATAAVTLVAGMVLLVWQYLRLNGALPGSWADYLGRSAKMALLWGPVWALVWLMRAQGVERRRGLLMRDEEAGR